jgi:hypothetical protein
MGGNDGPTSPPVGEDGPIVAGTGGVPGSGDTGGSGGSRLDAPGTGGMFADGSVAGAGGVVNCPYPAGFDGDAGWMCGSVSVSVSRRPVDVLLVIDQSGSMQKSLAADCLCTASTGDDAGSLCSNTTGCANRWIALKSAVGQTIANASGIQWGAEIFPSPGGDACSANPTPQVPVGADSGALVQSQIDAITPGGNTPTAAAISAAAVYLSTLADQNNKIILLATDGEPNCGAAQSNPTASDVEDTIAAITAAAHAGFPVYVIGMGPSIGNLDRMAQAGGTERYYSATTLEQLRTGFSSISRGAMSCTLALPGTPSDPDNIAVYVDKQAVPKDSTNGWTYGATTAFIELTGSYCANLLAAQDMTVQVLFGCSGLVPPICIP